MKQPHILCSPEQITPYVLLPGDPARTERIAEFLTGVEHIANNREFRTLTGFYEGLPVTVTSTGIGGASLVIALEELIQCGGRYFIRTGSCGACQKGIGIGDLVLSTAVVREDGASRMYVPDNFPAAADSQLTAAAESVLRDAGLPCHVGITRSHDSFYIDDEQERMAYWSSRNVLASDMETGALYVISSLRGVQALSILNNVVLYQGDVKEGIGGYVDQESAAAEGEKREILIALKTLKSLESLESLES